MNLRALIPSFEKVAKGSYDHMFTVFTPAYNCENTINRVHDSLLAQTFKDFEWLVINDGSSDNSHDVIKNIITNSPLNISYVNNPSNRHKIACFMQAIQLANGEFLLTFDADDACVPEALNEFNNAYNNLEPELHDQIAAVSCLCVDQNGKLIGTEFPKSPHLSNTFESYYIHGVKGEKWGFTKTDILKGITYDKAFVTNGFMSVGTVWNLIAHQNFLTVYINKALRIYYVDVENSISASNPEKLALGNTIRYITNFNWFFKKNALKTPVFFMKNLYFMLMDSHYLDVNLSQYLKAMDSKLVKIVFTLIYPIKFLFHRKKMK